MSTQASFFSLLLRNNKAVMGLCLIGFICLLCLAAPLLTEWQPMQRVGAPHQPPSFEHWLGTTRLGYDVWTQILYGGRISIMVGLGAGTIVAFLAVFMGITAAYFGKWIDEGISLLMNVVLVIPHLPLLIVLAALIGETGPTAIALIIGLTSWAWGGRVVRSQAMAVRQRDYIHAAEVLGERPFHVIIKELLPNLVSIIGSSFIGVVIYALMTEATLSFIGLGSATTVTWGTILYHANNSSAILVGAWWEIVAPAAAIILLGTGLALLNFAIDEVSNPRLRSQALYRRWLKRQKQEKKHAAKGEQTQQIREVKA